VDNTNKHWLSWQRHSRDQKTNFRLIIYGHSSINHAGLVNLAKIGPAGFEITGLTEIVKKKKQQQNI